MSLRERYHNATGTGELTSPSGDQPKARVTYTAMWYDPIGRQKAVADYGTNGGSALSRPDTVPARSDTVLVTTTAYNDAGQAETTTNPAGIATRLEYDDAGRVVKTIQNYVADSSSSSSSSGACGSDQDVTVETTYHADGQILTLAAKNPTTGDQVTKYVYGTDKGGITPEIYRNDLLRAEIYPDSDDITDPLGDGTDGVYDRVEYTYNRQGERITKKDQNETVHQYAYDALGRPTADKVTAVGTGVDDSVRRIATTYEVRGMVATITSYASADDAQGSSSSSSGSGAVNQVVFEYDDAGNLVKEYQEHDGLAVLSGGSPTPYVGYHYDDTSTAGRYTKGLRPIALRYPNGRLVHYTYGESGSTADAINRIDAICDDDSGSPGDTLAQYSYLGAGSIVQVDYPEPDLRYDLAHGSGDDPYDGLDRFGRVVDLLWRNYATAEDAVRIRHGYDRAGNRLWREDPVAASYGKHFDELYTYDGMYQLATMQRGNLDFTDPDNPVILSKTFAEDWSLDPTGNWSTYKQDEDGDDIWDLDQSRTHNAANEITQIAGAPTHVAHDRAGNMTRTPKPDDWNAHFDITHDAWHRLVKVKDGADTVAKYAYDGRSFRVLKQTYDAGQLYASRSFLYNRQWQSLEERVRGQTNADLHFVWGLRYIDDLVLRERDTDLDGTFDQRHGALQDPNWNVSALADGTGTVLERYAYAGSGEPTVLSGSFGSRGDSDYQWDTLLAGYRWDSETSSYQVRYRYLRSCLGRWARRDPIGYKDSLNPYQYVGGNSIRLVDSSGTSQFTTPDLVRVRKRCEAIIEERKDIAQTPAPPPITDKAASACYTKIRELFDANYERGGRKIRDIWGQFGYGRKDCHHPVISCECCRKGYWGYFDPSSTHGPEPRDKPGPTLIICWNNLKDNEDSLAATLMHEATHALQSCHKQPGSSCQGSLQNEMEAYYCEGSCQDVKACLYDALRSSCGGECATPEEITLTVLQNVERWFGTGGQMCTFPKTRRP